MVAESVNSPEISEGPPSSRTSGFSELRVLGMPGSGSTGFSELRVLGERRPGFSRASWVSMVTYG